MGCKFKSYVVVNGDDIRVMRKIFINNFIFLTALSIFFLTFAVRIQICKFTTASFVSQEKKIKLLPPYFIALYTLLNNKPHQQLNN